MMKVVIVGTHRMPHEPTSGGVARVVEVLSESLAKEHVVLVVSPNSPDQLIAPFPGYKVRYVKAGKLPGILRYWTKDAMRISSIIKEFNPDVIHFQGVAGWSLFTSGPKVFTFHGSHARDFRHSNRAIWLPNALRNAVATIFDLIEQSCRARTVHQIIINEYVFEMIGDIKMGFSRIPNPVGAEFFLKPPETKGCNGEIKKLVYVGRIGPRKNLLGILELVACYKRSVGDVVLCVCGDIESKQYFEQCREQISKSHLQDSVVFLGSLDNKNLIREMDSSDCLILMSDQETAPMVVSEAHVRGLPVLAPARFGLPDMINEGFNGFFLPPRAIKSQVSAMEKALNNVWDRSKIREAAKIKYHPDTVARKTVAAYEKAIIHYGK